MGRPDGVRLGQAQQVAVAAHVLRVVREPLAPEVGLGEPVALEQRAHGAVEHEDPLPQQPGQQREPGLARSGRDAASGEGRVIGDRAHRTAECSPPLGRA